MPVPNDGSRTGAVRTFVPQHAGYCPRQLFIVPIGGKSVFSGRSAGVRRRHEKRAERTTPCIERMWQPYIEVLGMAECGMSVASP